MFASLIKNNSPQYQGTRDQEKAPNDQNEQLDELIKSQMYDLLQKILSVFKENLNQIIHSQDGLYCMLFIKNCFNYLVECPAETEGREDSLNLIWQEFHVIMAKLTHTVRKVPNLRRGNSNLDTSFSSDTLNVSVVSDDLSALEQAKSCDDFSTLSGGNDISSSSGTNLDKVTSQQSDGSKVLVNYSARKQNRSEKRVYLSMCKHITVELYFGINITMIKQMGGISTDLEPKVLDENKKNIQECAREIQRVFKSIVQGPSDVEN